MNQTVILEFHDIHPKKRLGINTVSPAFFSELMQAISNEFPLSRHLNEPGIIISFDDAYDSIIQYGAEILTEKKIFPIVCVVTGFIGKPNLWDPSPLSKKIYHLSHQDLDHLIQLQWNLIPHGHKHIAYYSYNSTVIPNDIHKALNFFTTELGLSPKAFSLPFNAIDESSYSLVKTNLPSDTVILGGIAPLKGIIPRLPVYSFMSVQTIINLIKKWNKARRYPYFEFLKLIQKGAVVSSYWQRYIYPAGNLFY